jgi:hypothetical protein
LLNIFYLIKILYLGWSNIRWWWWWYTKCRFSIWK